MSSGTQKTIEIANYKCNYEHPLIQLYNIILMDLMYCRT